ncbi:cellulose synthase-like protein D4 isoform X2 [Prosopis cineraria]|uniref:cellulose synthase-like protein D4 isoform X2 n=1 Tax=Prosopis cineraria TaxID=364024 RepID=UPI00240FCAEA|nr:cellulose synthase-like protein D4 isoform X2 [Prosopis cineraria]
MASTNNNQPPKKTALRNSGGSSNQGSSRSSTGQTVKFARRTSSGRYVNLSKEDIDMSADSSSGDYMNYTVHIPPTPDNQPMDTSVAMKAEEQYVSNSLFTGGFNSVTRAHLMDKVIDSEVSHPQMAGAKGSACAVPSCDGKIMKDERGNDVIPCECRDCFLDAQKETGLCPGCREPYKIGEYEDDSPNYSSGALQSLPAPNGSERDPNSMSVMKRNHNGEFDHNRWLFETKGTYGVGNAYWPQDDMYADDGDGHGGGLMDLAEKPWKPLSRKTPIANSIISPYRLIIAIRFVVLGFFLHWRIMHPNEDAIWLWLMSVICEIWFAFSWLLDQIPKLMPCNRSTDLQALHDKFDTPSPSNPTGRSDLPGCDVYVSTADPEKEPVLVTANTILSILAVDYPVEKLCCYISDDGGALLTFEAMAEAASFADLWVPFCRKHDIEPRNPETYFSLKIDPTKNKSRLDFVKDRRRVKREYDEFKVRINGLSDSIRRRSDAFNAREEMKMIKHMKETGADPSEPVKVVKATWMADGTHWPGTWAAPSSQHAKGDHTGILQVMLKPPSPDPLMGSRDDKIIDFSEVETRLPMFVYMSREKRPGYDHNKKAGAMNALVRSSAILSNGPFILNLDCDHYFNNCKAIREGMCFMMDRGGEDICYIQFPQRFEGIDPSDRYANHNTVFFDGNMRALDGVQGPFYVGTGCMFRRFALYGFDPPMVEKINSKSQNSNTSNYNNAAEMQPLNPTDFDPNLNVNNLPKRFGNSTMLAESIAVAEYQGRPLADHPAVKYGRPPGALRAPREPLDALTVAEAVSVISCWYEDKTEWGDRVGWIYGSVTEDVVTGYRMHNRGWRSVYCITKRDAFRGTAPINLTDRLHQVLRWATGSVEIFFSKNNAFLAGKKLKFLQRLGYLNVGIYPFTSIFLLVYCFLPALSLLSGFFIVKNLSVAFLVYLLAITLCLIMLAILEVRWANVGLEEWWRNEQFWVIAGTSAHLAAVVQGLLKVIAGIEISFTLTSKAATEDNDDIYAELYLVKWTSLMLPPIIIGMVNILAIVVAFMRTIFAAIPQWNKFIGGAFFSLWVLVHLYPFAKGLMGRRRKTPTIVYVWSGLIAITLSLLWLAVSPPASSNNTGGNFQFP